MDKCCIGKPEMKPLSHVGKLCKLCGKPLGLHKIIETPKGVNLTCPEKENTDG